MKTYKKQAFSNIPNIFLKNKTLPTKYIMYRNDPYEELEEEWSWDTIETDSAYYDSDDQKGNPMS